MARTEIEGLAFTLEARLTDLEKGMARASKITEDRFKKISNSAKKSATDLNSTMGKAASNVNSALSKIGVGLSFAALSAAVLDTTSKLAEMGRTATRVGLSVEEFQKWRFVAESNGVAVDQLADSFKELNIRASEYADTGKGSAADAFAKLGMSPEEVKERLKNPSDLMLEIIDRTRRLKDTASGIRVFDEMFGGGGEQAVSLIEQGRKGIEATIAEAERLGIVMDEDIIRAAEETDKKFKIIASTVGTYLQSAIVNAFNALQAFISLFQKFEDRTTRNLQGQLDLLKKENEAASGKLGGWFDGPAQKTIEKNNAAIAKIQAELDRRKNENSLGALEIKDSPVKPYNIPDAGGAKDKEAKARDRAAAAAQREADSVRKLISDLEFERSLIGMSAVDREKAIAMREAGTAATDAQREKIGALTEAIYRETEAWENAQLVMAEINSAAREFTGTLIDGMLEGAKATEVLGNALKNLGSRLLNSGLDSLFNIGGSGGGLGGLFGGLFSGSKGSFPSAPGGLYSEGGYTGAGGKYEPAGTVHKGEYVFDADAVRKAGGPRALEAMRKRLKGGYADGGSVATPSITSASVPAPVKAANDNSSSFAPTYNIDARGADAGAVARIQASLDKTNREMQGRIEAGVRSAQKRNVKLG